MGYKEPSQYQLTIGVYGLVDRIRGLFIIECLYTEYGGGYEFGHISTACVHEDGDKERRDGDEVSVATTGGV